MHQGLAKATNTISTQASYRRLIHMHYAKLVSENGENLNNKTGRNMALKMVNERKYGSCQICGRAFDANEISQDPFKTDCGDECRKAFFLNLVRMKIDQTKENIAEYEKLFKDSLTHDEPIKKASDSENCSCNPNNYQRIIESETKVLEKYIELQDEILCGTWTGYCKNCGEAIHLNRLKACPCATKCTDCENETDPRFINGINQRTIGAKMLN